MVTPGPVSSEPGAKRLHPSLESHLSTELTILRAIIERSKFQHRSQPFLQRMREVHRLGHRVRDICSPALGEEEITKLKALVSKVRQGSYFPFSMAKEWKDGELTCG